MFLEKRNRFAVLATVVENLERNNLKDLPVSPNSVHSLLVGSKFGGVGWFLWTRGSVLLGRRNNRVQTCNSSRQCFVFVVDRGQYVNLEHERYVQPNRYTLHKGQLHCQAASPLAVLLEVST